jgi:hypothetical protein
MVACGLLVPHRLATESSSLKSTSSEKTSDVLLHVHGSGFSALYPQKDARFGS